ncbi:MAG TPA: hypothetical protein DCY45_03415 [Mesotoga sp.]|nr:hypothetical protein [Mesotoga sp.]
MQRFHQGQSEIVPTQKAKRGVAEAKSPIIAPCGIECSRYAIFLRTEEKLSYWRSRNVDSELARCSGCQAGEGPYRLTESCNIFDCCVAKRNLSHCYECAEFPCDALKERASAYPHHRSALGRLRSMKENLSRRHI